MKRILIVDDEKLMRYSLSAAFRNNLTETVTSADGRSALAALGEWVFDFCFLDIHLPDMSGIDIMKTIRQLSPRTKIIMMTGSAIEDSTVNQIRQQAYLFLIKPFDLYRVKRVLDAVPAGEKNQFQDFSLLEERLATERRAYRRRQEEPKQVTYSASETGSKELKEEYSADLIDISDTGTCIRTAHRLQPGSMIRFKDSLNDAEGIVRWSMDDAQNQICVAGIQFIMRER